MEANNAEHHDIIYPQNIKKYTGYQEQKMVTTKLFHLVQALELRTLNITKPFHQDLKLKLN